MKESIRTYKQLKVYQNALHGAMEIFEATKSFPLPERYAMIDQIRRSSRSVCANLAEAWRKRRYRAAFVAKLNDSESEASETQVWIEFAVKCAYLKREPAVELYQVYEEILRMIVAMINHPESWIIKKE